MNNINLPEGIYIVAVSGGVDSMVLLDILRKNLKLKLIVAHLDHGIRSDSDLDRKLVEKTAKKYKLEFISKNANLGINASEELAREVRYKFLNEVKLKHKAKSVITAHHRDDALETAILNLIRGTGRKGLSSLSSTESITRPFLEYSKQDLIDYADKNNIIWREDPTNDSDKYLRNYIRHNIIPSLSDIQKEKFNALINESVKSNVEIDNLLLDQLIQHSNINRLERAWFVSLPYDLSAEFLAEWLRINNIREFNRKLINKLVVFAKTAEIGKKLDIDAGYWLAIGDRDLELMIRHL